MPQNSIGVTQRCTSFFRLAERGSSIRRELWAGLTTFMVMAYIIFVNPAILSFQGVAGLEDRGAPFSQAMVATCFVAGLMTLVMGLCSNRPFALAPGMGLNAVVAFQLIAASGLTWPEAMGVVVLEGVFVTLCVLVGLREAVMHAIPKVLKHAIAVGIGCFIFFIGLINGGLVRVPVESIRIADGAVAGQPATPLAAGNLNTVPVLVTVVGLVLSVYLYARGWRSALLLGILLTTAVAIALNTALGGKHFGAAAMMPSALFAWPDWAFLTLPGLHGIGGIFPKLGLLAGVLVIFSLMLTDFFDTMGTIIGVSEQMGDVGPSGEVQNLRPMLLVDSLAAVAGGAVGASSVTTYIESAAGVSAGGRTGLAAVCTAFLFFLAMFFAPLAGVIPPQATAPALMLVGFLMAGGLREINWREFDEGLPALLTVLLMPLTYSITVGIGFGFLSYVFIKLCRGRARQVHWLMWCTSAVFLLYFLRPCLEMFFEKAALS